MISYATLDDGRTARRVCTLSPLAVAPAFQGQGVGSALVRAAVSTVERMGEPLVVLEGSPTYYRRLKFEPADPLGIHIHLPDWAPAEAAQVRRLPAYHPAYRGEPQYPPAFDAVTEGQDRAPA